ncbi:hypothetical protein GKQ38_04385 [Candidatus Nanohaloarchaea archaeon]|nr:hypothetical protein GKQ38_04385 [Candidatus Nanohaloarchaea archaeon]
MESEEAYIEINEEIAPIMEERARALGNSEFADLIAAETGDYTISDYLSPDRDDLNGATAGAAAGGGTFSYMSGGGPEEFAAVAVGAALSGYLKERWSNRDLGRQAAENSFEYWSERLEGLRE